MKTTYDFSYTRNESPKKDGNYLKGHT